MPWRKRAQVLAGAAVALAALALGMGLVRGGAPLIGAAVAGVALVATVLGLQAWWVRFDLPPPFGCWPDTFLSSSGTGVRRVLGSRSVALTFDDGPSPDTVAVLDELDRAGVRATFFLLGEAARAHPDVVREIARRGHVVASHGDTHRKLHLASPGTVAREIDAGFAAIRMAGVTPQPLFRAPHGFKGPVLAHALRRRGLRLVGWTRGVWDSESPPPSVIADRATKDPRGGAILLLHDGDGGASSAGRRARGITARGATVRAIPEIVRAWRATGHEFVTLERLSRERVLPRARVASASGFGQEPRSSIASPPRSPGAKALVRWGLIALAVVLIARSLRHFDTTEVMHALSGAHLPTLAAAAAANVLALAMQSGRWLAVVHPVDRRARPRDAFLALVAGYAIGLVIPARASDLARAHLMSRRTGVSTATLTSTAVVDHLLGSTALLAAVGLAVLLWPVPPWLRAGGAIASGTVVAILVALWFLRPRHGARPVANAVPNAVPGNVSYPVTGGVTGAFPAAGEFPRAAVGTVPGTVPGNPGAVPGSAAALRRRVLGFAERLREGLRAVGDPRAVALATFFAIAGWLSEGLIAHLSLEAFDLPSGVGPSMMAVVATTLSAAASVSPGNAGAFEIACIAGLSWFGIHQESALAFAIGYHGAHLLPTALIGGGWLLVSGFRPAMLRGWT